jgi:hypothetical protein
MKEDKPSSRCFSYAFVNNTKRKLLIGAASIGDK